MAAEERSDVLGVGVGSADTRLPLLVFQPGQAYLGVFLELLLLLLIASLTLLTLRLALTTSPPLLMVQ